MVLPVAIMGSRRMAIVGMAEVVVLVEEGLW